MLNLTLHQVALKLQTITILKRETFCIPKNILIYCFNHRQRNKREIAFNRKTYDPISKYSLFVSFQIFKLNSSKSFSQELILFDIKEGVRILHVEDISLRLKIYTTCKLVVKHSIALFDRISDLQLNTCSYFVNDV